MSHAVAPDKVVVIHYTLRGVDGKVLDRSPEGRPFGYLHGHANVVPGLERGLLGKAVGDRVTVVVPPADGYGESTGAPQSVPKREFPKSLRLEKHMPLRMQGSDGKDVVVWVHDVRGSRVLVHTDHPLAGVTLHFEVEVLDVRDATADELAHGHAHGPGGQAHP